MEYLLDEDGNRIRDKNGDYMFNAVHTTDWHEPETLDHWREQWAAAVHTKFEEKGLDVRIDQPVKSFHRLSFIPIYFPCSNNFIILSLVLNKPFYIFWWIT